MNWNMQGSKADMVNLLSQITTIDPAVLRHQKKLSTIAVAGKTASVAHRETTRIEDVAYRLLALFDLNMPLHYDDEEKAFRHAPGKNHPFENRSEHVRLETAGVRE
jgi:hypothetical protein